jgi:hypothetical protein
MAVAVVALVATGCGSAYPNAVTAARQPVPAEAPDSVPGWVRADSNMTGPSASIPVRFRKNLLIVQFDRKATQAERQAAIDLVAGTVVGGGGGTIYLVRITDPGDGSEMVKAGKRLETLPYVLAASPDYEMSRNQGTITPR